MAVYELIKIIYNPNSTGPGRDLAEDLQRRLRASLPDQPIEVTATEYAGHGETLAYTTAKTRPGSLVVSASGDGGYNDVINGLMRAKAEGAMALAGLLPAGNANDHHRETTRDDLVRDILDKKTQRIDLLKLDGVVGGEQMVRYSHSYIGLGFTPKVGKELNSTKLNRFNEIAIVLKTVWGLRPVRIEFDGLVRSFDSVLCSNIGTVSKIFTVSEAARHDDGKFEVTEIKHLGKVRLFGVLLSAATSGLEETRQVRQYVFRTIKPTLVQLDGEVVRLDGDSRVSIAIELQALECIV